LLVSCHARDILKEFLLSLLLSRDPRRIWRLLRKTLYLCALVGIVVLLLRVGDFSVDARNYVQDRLAELKIAFQQN